MSDDSLKNGAGAGNADGQGGNAGTGNSDKGGSDGGGNPDKVVFSPEQQSRVQKLIDEAYAKAYAKAIKTSVAKEEKTEDKKDTTLPDAKLKTLESQVSALREEKKGNTLLKAIVRHNVIDAEEISALLKGYVRLNDDNSFTVLNELGAERLNANAAAMTVDELVADWLSKRPHHLRASGTTGAGSSGGRFSGGGSQTPLTADSIRKMSTEELKGLIAGDGISIAGSAGQTFNFKKTSNPFIEARKKKIA